MKTPSVELSPGLKSAAVVSWANTRVLPEEYQFRFGGNLQWSSPIRIMDHISGIPPARYFRRLCELAQTIFR
jgi:hypothetical protein